MIYPQCRPMKLPPNTPVDQTLRMTRMITKSDDSGDKVTNDSESKTIKVIIITIIVAVTK